MEQRQYSSSDQDEFVDVPSECSHVTLHYYDPFTFYLELILIFSF